jgi:hypothetical protein
VYESRSDWRGFVDVQRRRIESADDVAAAIALRLEVGRTLEERVGDLDGASGDFRAVLESDPGNLEALRVAGWHLMVSAVGELRPEGFPFALDNGAWSAFRAGVPVQLTRPGRSLRLVWGDR